jgi:hypothetical protein
MYDDSKVSYEIEACEDDAEVRGNAVASGNDKYDRQVEDDILARLEVCDVWAWATVKVTATYEGLDGVEGAFYLGCCNYADEEDFKSDADYADMKDQARAELYAEMEESDDCDDCDVYDADAPPVEVIVIVRDGVVENVYTDRPANVQIKDFGAGPGSEVCIDGMEIGY